MSRRAGCRPQPLAARWLLVFALALILSLLGIETRELIILVLVTAWLRWCLRA